MVFSMYCWMESVYREESSSLDGGGEHSLLRCLPLLLQVAVSLQARLGAERSGRVPELPVPLLRVQVRARLVLLRRCRTTENRDGDVTSGRMRCDKKMSDAIGAETLE